MSWFYSHLPSREAELNEDGWRVAEGQQRNVELLAPSSACKALLLLPGGGPVTSWALVPGCPQPLCQPHRWQARTLSGVCFSSSYLSSGTTDSLHLLLCKMRYSSGYFRGKKSKPRSLEDFCCCCRVCPFCVSCKIAQTDPQKDSVLSPWYIARPKPNT